MPTTRPVVAGRRGMLRARGEEGREGWRALALVAVGFNSHLGEDMSPPSTSFLSLPNDRFGAAAYRSTLE
jgi:hypothetical protein